MKPDYRGGNGIELRFTDQTAFIVEDEPIVPLPTTFSDLEVCRHLLLSQSLETVVSDDARCSLHSSYHHRCAWQHCLFRLLCLQREKPRGLRTLKFWHNFILFSDGDRVRQLRQGLAQLASQASHQLD